MEIWYSGEAELVEPFASRLRRLPGVELKDIQEHHTLWWQKLVYGGAAGAGAGGAIDDDHNNGSSSSSSSSSSSIRQQQCATPQLSSPDSSSSSSSFVHRPNVFSAFPGTSSLFFPSSEAAITDVPHGFQLKAFAVLYSSFSRVLFLDADNTPMRDPAFLFETMTSRLLQPLPPSRRQQQQQQQQQYNSSHHHHDNPTPNNSRQDGAFFPALFWPEFWPLSATSPMHYVFRPSTTTTTTTTTSSGEQERPPTAVVAHQMESGQLLIDKHASWSALLLTAFVNSGGWVGAASCSCLRIYRCLWRVCLHRAQSVACVRACVRALCATRAPVKSGLPKMITCTN